MKKIIIILVILLLSCGCNKTSEEKLIGIWKHDDIFLKFNGDGTVYFTLFVDGEKKDVTFLSDEAMSIDDTIYKFMLKSNKLIINDKEEFIKIDSDENFSNYLSIESSNSNYLKEIEYEMLQSTLNDIGYLNYINEYFKIVNVPTEKTNFVSKENDIDLICQIVNVYNNGIQMNDKNCTIST